MIPLYVISGLISLGMIVHCVKTGRSQVWIYVLVILMTTPFIGSALYAAIEILPDLLGTRTSRRAMRRARARRSSSVSVPAQSSHPTCS